MAATKQHKKNNTFEQQPRVSVRRSTYHGQDGFLISGKDHFGRGVSIFSRTRPEAERIRDDVKAGREVTFNTDTPKRAKPAKSGTPTQRRLGAEYLRNQRTASRTKEGSEAYRVALRNSRDAMSRLEQSRSSSAKSVAGHVLQRQRTHNARVEDQFWDKAFEGKRRTKQNQPKAPKAPKAPKPALRDMSDSALLAEQRAGSSRPKTLAAEIARREQAHAKAQQPKAPPKPKKQDFSTVYSRHVVIGWNKNTKRWYAIAYERDGESLTALLNRAKSEHGNQQWVKENTLIQHPQRYTRLHVVTEATYLRKKGYDY